MTEEKIYHVKVPTIFWEIKFPGQWHKLESEEQQIEKRKFIAELAQILPGKIIYTEYSEWSGILANSSKFRVIYPSFLLWKIKTLFHANTPFGVHIIRIK